MHNFRKIIWRIFFAFYLMAALALTYLSCVVPLEKPVIPEKYSNFPQRHTVDSGFYYLQNNWLQQNKTGLWEMYLEGDDYERGLAFGRLGRDLNSFQEEAFAEQIDKLIPSRAYSYFLRDLIAWFNRDLEKYIPKEYLHEINGISLSADPKYEFIGPSYQRILNYHAAHDIGHALQNLALVGCTSFVLNENSQNMLVGRNFDFYVNDDFAKNKIVAFVNPVKGHKFVYITWASFIGVVSGMNEQGLTVTINAAKSRYPTKSADPISLIAREILQYAGNIEQAIQIARKRQSFVSESILIASAADNKAVIIEKTPDTLALFDPQENTLVCANHFQSGYFLHDSLNVRDMRNGPSVYRENRCKQLIATDRRRNFLSAASILRNRYGIDDADIGMGNEKAMNQLISHHSVIFMPHKKLLWVSTSPYQLGTYLCYNMDSIFEKKAGIKQPQIIYIDSLSIVADTFLFSKGYKNFVKYRRLKAQLQTANFRGEDIKNINELAVELISSNPRYYYVYKLLGDYWYRKNEWEKAAGMYRKVLTLEVEHKETLQEVQKRLTKIKQQN